MNDTKCGALALKLAKILGEVGKVAKSGHNSFHRYDYVTENDLVYAVRDKLSSANVFIFTSTEEQKVEIIRDGEKSSALTTVTTKHTFVDGDSGEMFSVLSQGQGSDVGDKGGYKAITGAMKYFLYKCFMIPTGDDPEADEKTDIRGSQQSKQTADHRDARPTTDVPAREAPRAPIAVPREASLGLRDKFLDGRWEAVEIHFGKNKGVKLGALADNTLNWYADEWQPKPFKGKIGEDDELLRAALDAYIFEKP